MLSFSAFIPSIICGAILGLTYAYFYKKAMHYLFTSLQQTNSDAEANKLCKQRAFVASWFFFILRCFFVLAFFACMYRYFSINIPVCGGSFVISYLGSTLFSAGR